jgi:branched-chain amino acid transport system substrate-binding protein
MIFKMRTVTLLSILGLFACRASDAVHIAVVTSPEGAHVARLAEERVNASGGINGVPLVVEIIEEERGASGHKSIAIAESLAADSRVLAVIGHRGSTNSIVAAQVYNARGVPQIAPNSSAPLYRQAGPFSFRLVAGDENQARFIAEYLRSISPPPRIALLYVNDDYGQALYDGVRAQLREAGTSIVYESPFLEGERFTAARELADAIAAAKPTLLLWLGSPPELATILPTIRSSLPDLRVLGSDGLSGALVHDSLGPHLRDGDRYVGHFNFTRAGSEYDEVATRFRAVAGDELTEEEALVYDGVCLIAEALKHGEASRDGVREYLESLGRTRPNYRGITGSIMFDEQGDAPPSYVLFEVHGASVRVKS